MKVTRYPHRYVISLSEAEFAALATLVDQGKSIFDDKAQIEALSAPERRVIRSERWRQVDGPLAIDETKSGRGGYAKAED